jgi:single-stranded-DNA-specific exonuclease
MRKISRKYMRKILCGQVLTINPVSIMKQWILRESAAPKTEPKAGLSLAEAVFARRGFYAALTADETAEKDQPLFEPTAQPVSEPLSIAGMEQAVELIRAAIDGGEKIAVYGDYDCDGVTSVVMLYSYLMSAGAEATWYIPSREEGYGLNLAAVQTLLDQDVKLFITVDNGVSCAEEIKLILAAGAKIIVTDHHEVPKRLPPANVIVHPQLGCKEGAKALAGCGVTLGLIQALEEDPLRVFEEYGAFAALGTIADVVPLVGENRDIVRNGLKIIGETENAGLRALLTQCGFTDDADKANITAAQLAYTVIPKINAAGRFAHAGLAAQLLLCEDFAEYSEDKENKSPEAIAAELIRLNTARQAACKEILAEVLAQCGDAASMAQPVLVAVGEHWHPGVIGVVSGNLLDKTGKPNIIISLDDDGVAARASARSHDGFNLYDLLAYCSDLLLKFGGHAKAGGFSILAENIPALKTRISAFTKAHPPQHCPIYFDAVILPRQLTAEDAEELSALEPYGEGNPEPIFFFGGCRILYKESLKGGRYVKMTLQFADRQIKALDFGCTFDAFPYEQSETVDMLGSLLVSEYNGRVDVSVKVKDMRLTGLKQDRYISAEDAYAAIICGEAPESRLLARITPDQKQIKLVYDMAKNRYHITYAEECAQRTYGVNPCAFRLAVDVLTEAGLITKNSDGKLSVLPAKGKTDLKQTPTMMMLERFAQEAQTIMN